MTQGRLSNLAWLPTEHKISIIAIKLVIFLWQRQEKEILLNQRVAAYEFCRIMYTFITQPNTASPSTALPDKPNNN